MKIFRLFLLLLLTVSAYAQAPIRRQFFTTNTDPIVEVVAGSNATVQASTPAANIRRFTVNGTGTGSGGGQTNDTFVAALTNVIVLTNSSGGKTLYSIGGLTDTNIVTAIARAQTNGLATTNFVLGSQVWTNDGTFTKVTGGSNVLVQSGITLGTNTPSIWGTAAGTGIDIAALRDPAKGEIASTEIVHGWSNTTNSDRILIDQVTSPNDAFIEIYDGPVQADLFISPRNSGISYTRFSTNVFNVTKVGNVEAAGIYYGNGAGLTNLPSGGTGSSNITDNAYYAVARNLTVNTNAEVNNLTVTNLTVDSGSGIGYLSLENSGTNIITLNGTNGTIVSVTNIAQQFIGDGTGLSNVPFAIFTNYAVSGIYTNVGALAFGTNLYGMTSFWTYASVPIVGTVPIFNFGIDTNTVITTNGGAFTGTILDNSVSSTAPANNQLVTAQWVRGLFAGAGVSYYTTTNINNTFTNADVVSTNTAVYEFSTTIPAYSRRVYTVPTNSSYMGQAVVTNRFQQLLAGATVNAYLESQNGSGTAGPQVKMELYVSYDGTNWFGDWDASPQYIAKGVTNLYSWVMSNPTYVSTNAAGFYVQRRLKMVTQTTPTRSDLLFHLGTNFPSHITLSADSGTSGNAYLAANQTFTGSNVFSTWLAGNGGGLTNLPARSVGITVDGGGSAITAGTKGYISVPYSGAIVSCTLMAQPSGSIEFRIWRTNSADASFPPTAAGAIGTNVLTSDNYNVDSTLTGWTKGINTGDVLGFNIPSAATSITNCTLQLKIQP